MPSTKSDASTPDVLNLSGVKFGNYRLERPIGRGRMGVVYLARDEALLRPTAVKILSWQLKDHNVQDPEAWFLSEARSVARVNHQNVVQIYGVARQGPYCYIAMEYVHGGSAYAVVAKNGPFPVVRATEILLETAKALKAAHDAGIVHRDVKPENLLIGADGIAKLGDFGMALHASTPRQAGPARAGTPFYTAPEIWSGQDATPKTDLYALGATYFYLLTGRVPFAANELQTLISAHLHAPIPSASEFDARIPVQSDRIIQQCLAKSAKDRFVDGRALALAAENLLLLLQADTGARRGRALSPMPFSACDERGVVGDGTRSEVFSPDIESEDLTEHSPQCYSGEPLKTQEARLGSWLGSSSAHTMVLLGESGSGRTTLAMRLLKDHATKGVALYFDGLKLKAMNVTAGILRQTIQTLTRDFSRSKEDVRRVVERISRIRQHNDGPALLVLDAGAQPLTWYERFAVLTRETSPSERWKLLVIDSVAQRERWEAASHMTPGWGVALSLVPRLTFDQSLNCVQSCIDAARASGASGLVMTPDACLLIAHRANGDLSQINRLIQVVVDQARADRALAVSSWDVWCVRLEGEDGDASATGAPNRIERPETWPTAPVLEILNQYRNSFGIPPRR
jgi:serine/threonine protein kinase